MKKSILFFSIIAIAVSSPLFAKVKLSPNAKLICKEAKETQSIAKNRKNASLKKIENVEYVSSIIKVGESFNFDNATAMGVKFGAKSGLIYTAQIPIDKINEFAELPNLEYINMESGSVMLLDSARSVCGINDAINGTDGFTKGYTGIGVVVGIIDVGFDYTHPAFYDTTSKMLRIKRVWDQTKIGTIPSGFNYGAEYSTDSTILAAKCDIITASHGSHVTAIAAGSKWPTAGKYAGIAQNADIVLVALKQPRGDDAGAGDADFLDGLAYIYNYAASVGKPAVVNLSWGGPTLGARDGRSICVQAMNDLTGAGKICVVSAGNSGDTKIHISKTFSESDTLLKSYVTYSSNLSSNPKKIWMQCWGDSSKSFSASVAVVDSASKAVLGKTDFLVSGKDSSYTILLPIDGDTVKIIASTTPEEFNKRPLILFNVSSDSAHYYRLSVNGKEGKVHVWNLYVYANGGYESEFLSLGDATATEGDAHPSISDMASADQLISVGAFVGKKKFTNVGKSTYSYTTATVANIASFSSYGPTIDGRIKPDICADGLGVVSAANSFDSAYMITGVDSAQVIEIINHNGKNYPYAIMTGTSMASPVTAGSVALMLEANHNLTPDQVKAYLKNNAKKDKFTGSDLPNALWGAGKLNLKNAMKNMLGIVGVEETEEKAEYYAYPNPATSSIRLSINGSGIGEAFLINELGMIALQANIDLNAPVINNLSNLSSGVYKLIVKQNGKVVFNTAVCVIK